MIRNCPICDCDKSHAIYDNPMSSLGGLDLSYTVVQCERCGLFFAGSLAPAQAYSRYYGSFSKYDYASEISEHDRVRMDAAVALSRKTLDLDDMIVDVGCGHGALLSRFQAAGFHRLYGIDPAPNSAEHAFKSYGLSHIYRGSMHETGRHIPLQDADMVCIMAVLEHLWDVAADLRNILQQLKPGCKVMVEVPPLDRFDARQGEPYGEFSLEHIQFFSVQSLHNLMASLGAKSVSFDFVELPSVKGYSLIGIYEYAGAGAVPAGRVSCGDDQATMAGYIAQSEARLGAAIEKVPAGDIVVYGAGSHTARLLPRLAARGGVNVVAVVDSNPNLRGVALGDLVVEPPEALGAYSSVPILVSSYRAQNQIAEYLRKNFRNELILLY